MIEFLWHDLIYLPLYNLLIFLYSISPGPDVGLALIFLTVLIRLALLPFSIRSARTELRLEKIKPILDQIRHRYRYNIEKQREATRRLLKKNKIGIYSNFFSIVFQLFFFYILYKIFSSGLQPGGYNQLYNFNVHPEVINTFFIHRIDLVHPQSFLSFLAAAIVFLHQGVRRVRHISEATTLDKVLLFGLPIGIYIATIFLPSSKALFVITSACFSLWIRFMKWLVVRFFLKDEELKQTVDDLWKA